jgi:hypothetical protein
MNVDTFRLNSPFSLRVYRNTTLVSLCSAHSGVELQVSWIDVIFGQQVFGTDI